MADNIVPINKGKVISYDDKPVSNFWLRKPAAAMPAGQADCRSKLEQIIAPVSDSVICVQTEHLTDPSLIKTLFDAAERGSRIYLLTNDYDKTMETLKGRCLIRFGLNGIGSFVLVQPNTSAPSGVFFTGQFTEGSLALPENLSLTLDGEQSAVLYRHFCRHFWNTATKEIIAANSEAADTGDSPVDVFPCLNNFCDADYVKNELRSMGEGAGVLTASISTKPYFDFATLRGAGIVTSLEGNTNDLISLLKEQGNNIMACSENINLNILYDNKSMWVIPKATVCEGDIFYALKANEAQRREIEKRIEGYKKAAEYAFVDTKLRGELTDNTILPLGESKEHEFRIEAAGTKSLPENVQTVLLPKAEFEASEPKDFPDDGKTVNITYTWRNAPFSLPKDAQKDKLYADWETETGKIMRRLDAISEQIKKSKEKESVLSKRIIRFFLGKKNVLNQNEERVAVLKSEMANCGALKREYLQARIEEINALCHQVTEDAASIDEENRKAKIDEEIDKLREEQKKKRQEKAEKEQDLETKKKDRDEKINAFCAKHNIERDKLEAEKQDWQHLAGELDKHKKSLEDKTRELGNRERVQEEKLDGFCKKHGIERGSLAEEKQRWQAKLEALKAEAAAAKETGPENEKVIVSAGQEEVKDGEK